MSETAKRPIHPQHPLREDLARLERIADLMWPEIQKVLKHRIRPRTRPGPTELTLVGGTSAEDVLQEALVGLLRYEPASSVNWEGLGVRIAQNKAKEALRKSRAYRQRADGSEITIASLDVENSEGEPLANQIPDEESTGFTEDQAVEEVERLERQLALRRVADQVLTDRDRAIVFRIQRGETRIDIKDDFAITAQRVGQIYADALERLRAGLSDDPSLRPITNHPIEGGNPDDE
jgi:RNA polymerase sigma factor (sigma-70 family)